MIVVATTEDEVAAVQDRLRDLGGRSLRVVAPSDDRRLVLATVSDAWQEERLVATLGDEGTLAVSRPDEGARLEAWRRHTRPIVFGDELAVCFAWSEHDRRELPRLIELGRGGFGNGDHPTTRLLVEALAVRIEGGERVLDAGCGSGVLGLCALGLGASHVVAVDIEAGAVEATRRNAVLNGVGERLEATGAPLGELESAFDVIVANVGRAAAVELAPELVRLMAPDGWLVVSGISPSQCTQVTVFLRPLIEVERPVEGEWAAVVLAHSLDRR